MPCQQRGTSLQLAMAPEMHSAAPRTVPLLRCLQDERSTELAVLTERAQSAASLGRGEIEVLVHRRTLLDDWRGVGEPINETMCGCRECHCTGLVARGAHWLTLQVCFAVAGHYSALISQRTMSLVKSVGVCSLDCMG